MAPNESHAGGMDFEPSEEVRHLERAIDDFLAAEVEPLEAEYDQFLGEDGGRNRVDDDGWPVEEFVAVKDEIGRRSADAGFYTLNMPEEVGGGGLGALEYLLLVEHLNNRNPDGFHEFVIDRLSVSETLTPLSHDEELRERYFDPLMNAEKRKATALTEPEHGSDITHMDTTAEKDGDEWVIDGTKCFVGNSPIADFIVVFARTSGEDGDADGISAFVVDRDNPGWTVEKVHRPMGTEVGRQALNQFDACRVSERHMIGDEGQGFRKVAMESVGAARLMIPARAVGKSQWMFEASLEYAEDRIAFGEPIGTMQFVQGMLAEMRMDIEAVRWLYRHAAWRIDVGDFARWEQSAAKYKGAHLWNDVADRAVQIHGGAGYMRSLPFEGQYRDARAARIYDGTDEIQKRTIARQFLDV